MTRRWKAAPPSRFRLMTKWMRRHRSIAWSAAAIILLVFCGSLLANFLILQEKERTDNALVLAQAQEKIAKAQRRRAFVNIDNALGEIVRMIFLLEAKDLANLPDIDKVRKALTQHTLTYFSQLIDEKNPDFEARLQTARAYLAIAIVFQFLKDDTKAHQSLEKSSELIDRLALDYPTDPTIWDLCGHAHCSLAATFEKSGAEDLAVQEYRKAVNAFGEAYQIEPDSYWPYNNLAFLLITRPEKPHYDPNRAVTLAVKATKLAPENDNC